MIVKTLKAGRTEDTTLFIVAITTALKAVTRISKKVKCIKMRAHTFGPDRRLKLQSEQTNYSGVEMFRFGLFISLMCVYRGHDPPQIPHIGFRYKENKFAHCHHNLNVKANKPQTRIGFSLSMYFTIILHMLKPSLRFFFLNPEMTSTSGPDQFFL